MLELPDAGAVLAGLARSNLLLVPLDRRGQWYRYHHLFRDILLAELERQESGLIPVLRRRAAGWCLRNDLPEEALEYSMAAEDTGMAAGLVRDLFPTLDRQSRVATLQRWIRWLDDRGEIDRRPMLAVWAMLLAVETGQPAQAERWADAVDRWQYLDGARPEDPAAEGWAAVLRAILCRRGIEQMRADADEAAVKLKAENIVAPLATLLQGIVHILDGDLDGADPLLRDAVSATEDIRVPEVAATALCERSVVAMARGEWDQAERHARQADVVLRRAGFEDIFTTPLVCAVQARVAVHRGDVREARRQLAHAQRLRPLLTSASPHIAVQARLELTRVHLALADLAGARTLMREIDELIERRPDLGVLIGEAQALRDRLCSEHARSVPGASSLTAAELRVLPLLATHLSFPEIGAELFLSPHTVKSQAISIYRKLGAVSRSQAVARSRELALLEG